jgi:hypothetical protein
MTELLAGRGGRVLGRSLLTLANAITALAPLAADWNDSHIFNTRWPAHARFHGVTVPVAYWVPFFVAPLVPGTAVDDPPHPVGRVAGMPVSLLGAAATTAAAAAGWLIDRRSAQVPPESGAS